MLDEKALREALASLPEFLSTKQVADILGISTKSVKRRIQDGSLCAIQLAAAKQGRYRVDKNSLLEFIKVTRVGSDIRKILKKRADH